MPGDPDPAGARLDALRAALAQHPHIANIVEVLETHLVVQLLNQQELVDPV